MKVESIAECSPWSILQYFRPAFCDNWSWKPIFGLFESGQFTQVLLYIDDLTSQNKDQAHKSHKNGSNSKQRISNNRIVVLKRT